MTALFREIGALRRTNSTMTLAVALLMGIGILFIFSACQGGGAIGAGRSLHNRQILWTCVGTLLYAGCAVFDYRRLARLSVWLYALAVLLLVLVLAVGTERYGARRWLWFFQPSEAGKAAVVLALAGYLAHPDRTSGSTVNLVGAVVLASVPATLIALEPDLGTALVFIPVLLAMWFVAGAPMRIVGMVLVAGLLTAAFVVAAVALPDKLGLSEPARDRIRSMGLLTDYQRQRIEVFLNPDHDPLGKGWSRRQSEIAVGSGGVRGKGFRQGDQNILGFLPRTVAPTDFIYSVIAEEWGFVGSLTVLLLYATVMGVCLTTAFLTRDPFGRLLCVGVLAILASHVFVNIGMTIGLAPVTGLPLPLISYGGTFMVVTCALLGMVQSVYARSSSSGFRVLDRRAMGESGILS